MDREILAYYATPGCFTGVGGCGPFPDTIDQIVEVVQGLLVYDVVAGPFYGVELTSEQAETIHERDTVRLLAAARAVDGRPLDQPRPPANRVGARCHIYSR